MRWHLLLLSLLVAARQPANAAPLPDSCRQLVIGTADSWDSSSGRIQLFQRDGDRWRAASPPMRVLFGRNGLAWGIGVAGQNESGLHKEEKDRRAPAGIFELGTIYTYDHSLPGGTSYPFHQITERDAWIDDPTLPDYNRHVVIDPGAPPPWFEKQKMRLNDPPHRWLIEIRHNSNPPIPGAGSAIFFHIQRGPNKPSAGCTTMPPETIVSLIRWLDASRNPHYVLLPKAEYKARWKAWKLPSPDAIEAISGHP